MSIYLDNNATTPLHPKAKEAIIAYIEQYGNPGSLHEKGREAKTLLDKARSGIADFIGADVGQLIFTSCASESNNTILKSVLNQEFGFTPHIIISAIEHPSVLNTAQYLAKKGVEVTYLPVTHAGVIELETFLAAIKKETVLVSIIHANNEIGTIQPIDELAKICATKNIFFHSDMVQALGQIPFSLKKIPVDAASFSAHKMYAPKGIGLLYLKDPHARNTKFKLTPLLHGGHQEEGLRAGTENTLGILALAAVCNAEKAELTQEIAHVKKLRDAFETRVKAEISDIVINGEHAPRKPNTSNISFKFIEGESILLRLDMNGIAVSTGSACSTGSLDPSHVIMALHDDPETAHGSIRFSFGRENTIEEIDTVLTVLKETVTFLRSISPLTPR